MLALPVATALNGFIPSMAIMVLAWLAMTCTGLYLVESSFWMPKDSAHLVSISDKLLGRSGKNVAWLLYLFISYASLIAYTAGGGMLLSHAFNFDKVSGCLLFTVLFGPFLFLSHKALGRFNAVLFLAMIALYVLVIGLAGPEIDTDLLLRENWHGFYVALPLFLTAFSFQTMVPSLPPYLNHHAPSVRLSIIAGTTIALIVYVIWQASVLGTVPLKDLLEVNKIGGTATHVLGKAIYSGWIEIIASAFAFFALVTSYFGMGLGLYDFLSDGLKIPKKSWGNVLLGALIVIPSFLASISFERVFISALDASGGFGDAILNGIMPVLMVVSGRYYLKLSKTEYQAPGGKSLLALAFIFYIIALAIEILIRLGHLSIIHTVD